MALGSQGSLTGGVTYQTAQASGLGQSNPATNVARWLLDNQQTDGRILDSLHGEHGTYAAGLAALTFALMAERAHGGAWEAARELAASSARKQPHDSEFDQFGLLLLSGVLPAGAKALPEIYHGRRLVSNNWVAMRAFNATLRHHLSGSRGDAAYAEQLWNSVLDWQTSSGLFIDSPGGEATPITYHAKFCAMLALAEAAVPGFSESELGRRCLTALQRGLDALSPLISPAGVISPYGRSRNTLFGQSAAIFALRAGARLLKKPAYTLAAGRAQHSLSRFMQPDGHIPCVLNEGEADKRDWDVYVNNPDYNAYGAALLLLADRYAPWSATPSSEQMCEAHPRVVHVGPLMVVRTPETYAVFATSGQSVPLGTPFFSDHRYYGMQPLWIESNERCLLRPSTYQWREDRSSLTNPEESPWIPFIERGTHRWCVRTYDTVDVSEADGNIHLQAVGNPQAYQTIPRWQRALGRVTSKLGRNPGRIYRIADLAGIQLSRSLTWNPETREIAARTALVGALPPGAKLHPAQFEQRL